MTNKIFSGWDWLEKIGFAPLDDNPEENSKKNLARAFARTFSSPDGERVLAHLRSITFDRYFGPETTESTLRYAEGQRALVACIEAFINQGRM